MPRDVRIFSRQTGGGFWLFSKDKDHYASLEGDYLRTFAIRVTVAPGRREEVLKKVGTVSTLIRNLVA